MRAYAIGALVLLARVLTFPRTPWDADELRFDFRFMVAISIAASVVTAVAFAKAYCDDMAALLFSFSAAALVHGAAGRLDAASWMFVTLALWMLDVGRASARPSFFLGRAEARPTLVGLLAGAAVACQPAMLFSAIALLFAASILMLRERRVLALIAFAVVLAPFVAVPEDVTVATGLHPVRFVLHPWGSKWVALPLMLCVAAGVRPLLRDWDPKTEVLLWFALVHVGTGMALVDPADGVRFVVPSLLFTSLVAAKGLRALRVSWIGAAALCALSVWYAWPLLRDRVTRPSPPVQAARAIPRGVVVLTDRETAPFARGLPLDEGLRRYVDRPSVPLLHFAYGHSNAGRVFAREDRDPYGKLTRNAYRRVSLVPIEERYAPVRGAFGIERNEAGESWRWLQPEAELRAPSATVVELRLPANAGIEFNDVQVNEARVRVRRGETVAVRIAPAKRIVVRAARLFALEPPDTREVAVQLVRVGR